MSEEGEFKKRLLPIVQESGDEYWDYSYHDGTERERTHENALDEIIVEAKKEFPKRADFPCEITIEAIEDRFYVWFLKWFGKMEVTEHE